MRKRSFLRILFYFLIFLFILITSCSVNEDSPNAGSKNLHVKTDAELISAISLLNNNPKGGIIFIDANNLSISSQLVLNKEFAYITIQSGKGYQPVLDFNSMGALTGDSGAGIKMNGSYYTLKGLTITKAPTKGIIIKSKMADSGTSSYNTLENCVFSYNGDSGVSISTNDSTNNGTKSSYNLVKNCDSYMNADLAGSTGPGGNADGFSCKLYPGIGNRFIGCRAWNNSDDGFDYITTTFPIITENCWTWHNGDGTLYTGWTGTWGGNGQGFKGGGGGTTVAHIFKKCIAFDTWYGKTGSKKGFDSNNNLGGNIYYNCVAFDCQYGFYYAEGSYGIPQNPVLRNCVSFDNTYKTDFTNVTPDALNNDWNLGLVSSSADFKSIDVSLAIAARQADGSLPNNDFCKLVDGSQLINQGINIGIPYNGTAPDLGAFEHP